MTERTRKLLTAAVLAASIIFIIYGAYRGEADTLLSKAIKICLECVGIG